MKKFGFILSLILALFLVGCDNSLKITKMDIMQYPYRIIYYLGKDTGVDLNGGKILLTTKGKQTFSYDMNGVRGNNLPEFQIISNADFTKEGVFVVKVIRSEKLMVEFPIQIVDLSKIP